MAKKLTTESIIVKTEPVKMTGLVTVIATKKAKHLKPGTEYKVDAKLAETLIKKGSVILKK
jgi:hypothetical protein